MKRQEKKMRQEIRDLRDAEESGKDGALSLPAVMKIQAAIRGVRARREFRRQKELLAWETLKTHRAVLLSIVYVCSFLYLGFAFYICALYGVKFTPNQTESWMLSSCVSFGIDILITQPIVLVVKTLFGLVIILTRTGTKRALKSRMEKEGAASSLEEGILEGTFRIVLEMELKHFGDESVMAGRRNSTMPVSLATSSAVTVTSVLAKFVTRAGRWRKQPVSRPSDDPSQRWTLDEVVEKKTNEKKKEQSW